MQNLREVQRHAAILLKRPVAKSCGAGSSETSCLLLVGASVSPELSSEISRTCAKSETSGSVRSIVHFGDEQLGGGPPSVSAASASDPSPDTGGL